jgi:hypothetical protein
LPPTNPILISHIRYMVSEYLMFVHIM